jgi:hypothetical protein
LSGKVSKTAAYQKAFADKVQPMFGLPVYDMQNQEDGTYASYSPPTHPASGDGITASDKPTIFERNELSGSRRFRRCSVACLMVVNYQSQKRIPISVHKQRGL